MSKSDPQEQPRRRNWVSALAPGATAVAQAAFARAGFTDPSLLINWDAIAGPDIARFARPLRLTQGKYGGVLTLLAEPGAAVFLQHDTRALCDRINTFLGRPIVARLKFVQGALTQKPGPKPRRPAPGPISPDDPAAQYKGPDGLREALWRLARARRIQG